MDRLDLGKKFKDVRLELNLTQQQVAGDFITRNMLSKIENNTAVPSLNTIKYLAEKLNKPVSFFLGNEYDQANIIENQYKACFEHVSFLFKNGEYENVIEYIEGFLLKNKDDSNNLYFARILLFYVKSNIRIDNYNSIEDKLNMAIEILDLQEDFYFLAEAYFYKSNIYFEKKLFNDCENFIRKAISYLNKSFTFDIFFEIKLIFTMGIILSNQNKLIEAIDYFDHCLTLSKQHQCFYSIGEVYNSLAIAYRKLYEFDKAIDYSQKAVSFFNILDDNKSKASCEKNLGNYYLKVNDFVNAEKYLNNSLSYFYEVKNHKQINTIKSDLLESLVLQGLYEESISYGKGIELEFITIQNQARVYMFLGQSYIGMEDYNSAESSLYKAEELAINCGKENLLIDIYKIYSTMYSKIKDFEKAFIFSEKANALLSANVNK